MHSLVKKKRKNILSLGLGVITLGGINGSEIAMSEETKSGNKASIDDVIQLKACRKLSTRATKGHCSQRLRIAI